MLTTLCRISKSAHGSSYSRFQSTSFETGGFFCTMYICLSFFHHIGVSNLHFRILQMITVRYIPAPGFPSCDWLVPSPPPRASAAVSESVNLKPDPFLAVLALCCAGAPVFRDLLEVLPALMARTVSMTRAVCSLKTKNGSKSTRT